MKNLFWEAVIIGIFMVVAADSLDIQVNIYVDGQKAVTVQKQ